MGLIRTTCPNCASAWSSGCFSPKRENFCMLCSNKKGVKTGWVWSRLVDPFLWINHRVVERNLEFLRKKKESENE